MPLGARRLSGLCAGFYSLVFSSTSFAAGGEVSYDDAWDRVRPWEYAATIGGFAGGLVARYAVKLPNRNVEGGFLFDDAVLDATEIRYEPTRQAVAIASDVMLRTIIVYQVTDSVLVPGLLYEDWDLASQLGLMDAEAYGIDVAILWGAQLLVRRERPIVHRCNEPDVARSESSCRPGDEQPNRSFIAGHTLVSFTAAGLTCVHHLHVPLYGGVGDGIACGVSLGLASLVGAGRMVTGNHYPSDTLLAVALGLASGWLLPLALHYGFDTQRSADSTTAALTHNVHSSFAVPLFQWEDTF